MRIGVLLPLALLAWTAMAAEPVEVIVPGTTMVVNGQAEIATGLMGVHAYKLTAERIEEYGIECIRQIHFSPSSAVAAIGKDGQVKPLFRKLSVVIDCPGDRYHPPTVLSKKDYEAFFTRIGTQYGLKCKQAGWPGIVEFWNEPYLNWASRSHGSGRNVYNPKWYKTEGRTDGGKVTIKGWDEPLEHLRWRKHWAKGEDGKIYYGVAIPEGLDPGDTFRGHSPRSWYFTNRKEQTFTVVEQWGIWDPTQVGFWSGRQNRAFYLWMFKPFAKAVKAANPDVKVIGGWDFGLSGGDWAVWRELYKPVIDQTHPWLDGITDHHYGVNSRMVPLWYEVACAYSVNKYGKWLKGYNTECGGKLDPAVHGQARNVSGTSEGTYALRDIMELLYHCPAKSGSRTAHHPDKGVLGTLAFLKPLRGKLLVCNSSDPDIWPVAAVQDDRVTLVAFNNARAQRTLQLALTAPAGTEFRTGQYGLDHDSPDGTIKPLGRTARLGVDLPALRAVRLVLKLDKAARPAKPVTRKQFFAAGEPLVDIPAGQEKDLTVEIPATTVSQARGAQVKLLLQGVDGDELSVRLNGRKLAMPSRNFTTVLAIEPGWLQAENTLRFHGGQSGYRVVVASLLVDTE